MPAINDKTGIANLALINLGQGTVNNIDDPGISHAASVVAQVFDDARQLTLRAGAWRFALERMTIAREAATPNHSWQYQFLLPTRVMLLHQVGTDDQPLEINTEYKLEKRRLITNEEGPLPIVFVDDVNDIASYPPDFKFALAAYIAHLAAPDALKSTEKAAEMLKLFEFYMDMAANNNALENPPFIIKKSKWLGAQRSLGRGRTVY